MKYQSLFFLIQNFGDCENSKSFVEGKFSQKEDLWFRNYETFKFQNPSGLA